MYDNYNYPCGADTPDAPWNETLPPNKEFRCNVVVTMNRDVTVRTNGYEIFRDTIGKIHEDTTNIDFKIEYENQHLTIPQLLMELEKYVSKDLEGCDSAKRNRLIGILDDCRNWKIDEIYVEEL